MQPSPVPPTQLRFGPFEVDLAAAELRKRGRKVPLQDQPFKVLALLLQHPGELVTREELQRALWPGDTKAPTHRPLRTPVLRQNSIRRGKPLR